MCPIEQKSTSIFPVPKAEATKTSPYTNHDASQNNNLVVWICGCRSSRILSWLDFSVKLIHCVVGRYMQLAGYLSYV